MVLGLIAATVCRSFDRGLAIQIVCLFIVCCLLYTVVNMESKVKDRKCVNV